MQGKKSSNTSPAPVAQITDPKTGVTINVIPKKGESREHAIARVSKRHRG